LLGEWSKYISFKNFFNYFGIRILTENPELETKRELMEEGYQTEYVVDTVFDKLKLLTETWGFTLKKALEYKKNLKGKNELLSEQEKTKLNEF